MKQIHARLASLLVAGTVAWSCSSSTGPDSHPPSVSITAPLAGATFSRGDTVEIAVTASDADGAVVAVRLYADGTYVGVDSASPYQFHWDTWGASIGRSVLRAVAWDDEGATAGHDIGVSIRWAYYPPDRLDDGWETSTLDAEGFDTAGINSTMNNVYAGGYEFMHALLVARNGKLVLEEYFGGFVRDSLQHLQSTTKSFTSALIGIAIDRGEIGSIPRRDVRLLTGIRPPA